MTLLRSVANRFNTMVRKLIEWAVANPLVVLVLAVVLCAVGGYAFWNVNVEAYPDPAPAIIEVVAQYPGASAEEVERLVTIPLEVALGGMPGLETTRTKSMFGLSHLRNQFLYTVDYEKAKQEVINRLQQVTLPPGVTPQLSPESPTGEIYRYTLVNPTDAAGHPIYTLADLRSVQDYTLQREFLRVPRVAGVASKGAEVRRYEIQPDPALLRRYGVTLQQLSNAIANSNANVGGDYLTQGHTTQVVRCTGLIGGGQDPIQHCLSMTRPAEAAAFLRAEENRRIQEIRDIVLASVNNVPVRVGDVVDGGPVTTPGDLGKSGVVVGHATRLGQVGMAKPGPNGWEDHPEKLDAIVLLRKGNESLPALRDIEAKVKELNEPGHMPPGMRIEPYYDRTELIGMTTETVRENLLLGVCLVSMILLMFLSNVRAAIIVAINIPLALLFAFGVLFLRGRSANLLSIGAVDFGIIVDSTVIMVESIFRHLRHRDDSHQPMAERIVQACAEVQKSLLYATVIMVCALLPLFTMKGPEGQIFGPMADTYAFALAGAFLLATTLSPVLCLYLFRHLKPGRPNFVVRWLNHFFLWQLRVLLRVRWLAVVAFVAFIGLTAWSARDLGREFMPELEEGNLYVRGTFPINISLDEISARTARVRQLMEAYPEAEAVVSMIGRDDTGTDPTGYYNLEMFIPLKPEKTWPVNRATGRPRTKDEVTESMNDELQRLFPGVDWGFSQNIRDNVMEALSGVKGDNAIKIFGPELAKLEELAETVKSAVAKVRGVENVGVFHIQGQTNLEFPVDRAKCSQWNVAVADVQAVLQTAVGGKAFTQMVEGERTYDVTLRWPERLRNNEEAILNIPVDVANNQVTGPPVPGQNPTPVSGGAGGVSASGTSLSPPALTGSQNYAFASTPPVPQRRLGDLVTPSKGKFLKPGASTIYREQGQRLIAMKFDVRGRDLAGTVAEAQDVVRPLVQAPYRTEWAGEFDEMQQAEQRLLVAFAISMALIVLLLYLAFRSFLDALAILSNVLAVSLGGIWALHVTGLKVNVSTAVGFISILGVAVMNGLLFVSVFNRHRRHGADLRHALIEGTDQLVRPVAMTALAAILGLLPAALSTKIGSQSQRPLAIVVVGGMLMTLVCLNLIPVLYSFYGKRTPPAGSGELGH
jgi:cobalt-zinc-cadmium resistance protein CzcA